MGSYLGGRGKAGFKRPISAVGTCVLSASHVLPFQ